MDAVKTFILFAVCLQGGLCTERKKSFSSCHDGKGSFYDFSIDDIHGLKVPVTFHKNHVAFVINVATY